MIGTIEQELALCREAFKGSKIGDSAWCVHHNVLCELLTESAENRIYCILAFKSISEQARRLHEFRPVKGEVPATRAKTCATWEKAGATWVKAGATWEKARATRVKAGATWEKAEATWEKARATWEKARATWKKACATWEKAEATREKARATWEKACATWEKAEATRESELEILHAAECPDSTWNGMEIVF